MWFIVQNLQVQRELTLGILSSKSVVTVTVINPPLPQARSILECLNLNMQLREAR